MQLDVKKFLTKIANTIHIKHGTTGAEIMWRVYNDTNGRNIRYGIGSGGDTRGIWDSGLNGWMLYANGSNNVFINGFPMQNQRTSTITDIIAVNSSNATIVGAWFARWGNIAQLQVGWTNKNAISVPASGNIENIVVGTIVSGKRPTYSTGPCSNGDNAGQQWYTLSSDGVLQLGACEGTGTARTIAAGTRFNAYATYILA